MNSVDTSKRFTLSALGSAALVVTSGGILIPRRAYALDPSLILIFIPSMITAIAQYFSASKTAEIQRENLRLEGLKIQDNRTLTAANLQIQWLGSALSSGKLSHTEAVDAIKKVQALFNVSSNYDGNGTGVSVEAGLLNINRGQYGGALNAPQATNALTVFKGTGSLATPVDNAHEPTKAEQEAASENIASSLGISESSFEKKYGILSSRPFSRARYPTKNGADMNMVTVVNKEAIAQGKPAELNVFVA
jgi:hypothetical protein